MPFIHTADLHLSNDDSLAALEYVLQIAREIRRQLPELYPEGFPVPIIMAGDIWDSDKVSSTLLDAVKWTVQPFAHEVVYFYVQGNHDACKPSWINFLGVNTVHVSGKEPVVCRTSTKSEIKLIGLDYLSPDQYAVELDKLRNIEHDAFITHQGFGGKTLNGPDADEMKPVWDFGLVLCGDIHIPHVCRKDENSAIVYPGATHRRTIIEPNGSINIIWTKEELEYLDTKQGRSFRHGSAEGYEDLPKGMRMININLPYRQKHIIEYPEPITVENAVKLCTDCICKAVREDYSDEEHAHLVSNNQTTYTNILPEPFSLYENPLIKDDLFIIKSTAIVPAAKNVISRYLAHYAHLVGKPLLLYRRTTDSLDDEIIDRLVQPSYVRSTGLSYVLDTLETMPVNKKVKKIVRSLLVDTDEFLEYVQASPILRNPLAQGETSGSGEQEM